MKVFYNLYHLNPLKKANRLSSKEVKTGVFLKAELAGKIMFADYFPHIPLGDNNHDQFLNEFKFQQHIYDKKVFDLLLKDPTFQNLTPKKISNHQLLTEGIKVNSPFVKYKLQGRNDLSFLSGLPTNKLRVRLDANGLFNRDDYFSFLRSLPKEVLNNIDYIEDPLSEPDWTNLELKVARDFVEGSQYDYYIYKPNCEFIPTTDKSIIFSSYMGSSFGMWHAYCELLARGNLSLTHGIFTEGFYQEEYHFFLGDYHQGFIADMKKVKFLYQTLTQKPWKLLCSM